MVRGKIRSSERGVAIIIAISVLAILTILIMGLAYSAGTSRHDEAREVAKERVAHLARLGFDMAITTLSHSPTPMGPKEMTANTEEGTCVVSARPATPNDAIYAGKFIRPRVGDAVISVLATTRRGAATQKATQTYLLNVDPAQPRRLLYEESISDMELPKKTK